MLLQTGQTQSCLTTVCSICVSKYDISDPTLVDRTSSFFVLCTNLKVYLFNHSKWVELSMTNYEGKGYRVNENFG